MIRSKLFSILALAFFVASSLSSVYADDENTKSLTIVAFGDSTTAIRSSVKQVYADRLPGLLKVHGIAAKVINSGVGGSHTGRLEDNARHKRRHALDRLQEAVRDHKPDVVVVQFGWNDSWVDSINPKDASRIPIKNYAANLKHIVTTLKADGARVILLTPNRPHSSLESWRVKRTSLYVAAVRKLAKAESVPLVDVWAEFEKVEANKTRSSNELLLDNVHPNDKGHELVARLLSEEITRSLSHRKRKPKPNVVFIAIDDLRTELGCYGCDYVKSPNIDRLASKSVLFRRAYCQQPLCNPSRTSLMTGLRPETVGVLGNHTYFRKRFPDITTLPQQFKKNGYTSVGIGKMYHGPFTNDSLCSAWDRLDDPPSWSEPAIRFGPQYYFTDKGIEAARKVFNTRNRNANADAWKTALLFGPMTEAPDVPDNTLYDGKVGDAAIAKLRELKKHNRPFFLGIGFIKPHTPYVAPKKYWDMYNPKEIPLAKNPKFPETAPQMGFHRSGEIRRYTDQPKSKPFTEANRRNLKHGYLACISHVDAQVGRVLDELDRLGIADNTIVVLWGDHGYHLGEQNIWGKHTSFENAARVPLIVKLPKAEGNGKQSQALVELVDLYPTLVDLAGLPVPDHLEGVSFRAVLDQPNRDWKTAAFTDQPTQGNWDRGASVIGRSMKTTRYRYTAWIERSSGKVVARQLFDHQDDPLETKNLAADSQYGELVEKLQKQLTQGWRAALGSARQFVAKNTAANAALSKEDLRIGFEHSPAGSFTRLDSVAGTWEAAKGHATIHTQHSRSGLHSLRLLGGKTRQVVWTPAKSETKPDRLSFWFERWTRRTPWTFRVEAFVNRKWKTLHNDTNKAVTGSFRNRLSLKLGDRTPTKFRFTCSSPGNTGVMIDDLRLGRGEDREATSTESTMRDVDGRVEIDLFYNGMNAPANNASPNANSKRCSSPNAHDQLSSTGSTEQHALTQGRGFGGSLDGTP